MTTIMFHGLEIVAYLEDDNVVVECVGEPLVDITFSKERTIGTNKYVDRNEIVVSSTAIKLRFARDFNKDDVKLWISLNI